MKVFNVEIGELLLAVYNRNDHFRLKVLQFYGSHFVCDWRSKYRGQWGAVQTSGNFPMDFRLISIRKITGKL